MKRILLIMVLAILLVSPVVAFTNSLQAYDPTGGGTGTISTLFGYPISIYPYSSSTGAIVMYSGSGSVPGFVVAASPPSTFTYAAFDDIDGSGITAIRLYDSSYNVLTDVTDNSGYGRHELKMIGGVPTVFYNGVQVHTGSTLLVNPSYFAPYATSGYSIAWFMDNVVIGGSDHHVIGALPSNWSIIRDFLNPSSTGVYAWNPATNTWVLEDSYNFYVDADTDSTDNIYTENLLITNMATGAVVNTTPIDSTIPRHQIQYSLSKFFSDAAISDGEYSVGYQGSAVFGYFWVISSGASISWDKTIYPQSATATISYTITSSYWQSSTYKYSLTIINTAGETIQTYGINAPTGTQSLQLNPTTYSSGVYYAEIIATDSNGNKNIMNYAAMQVTAYSYISGYVMNAETGSALPNAMVNITQGATVESEVSASNGTYTMTTGWLTGITMSVITNHTGYTTDTQSFSPLAAGNILKNISLLSTSPTHTGVSIGGILNDNQYGNPITSATVNIYNVSTSESYSTTSNIAGYYIMNNLVGNRLYNITSSKSGYSPVSQPVQVVAVGT